MCPNVTVRTKRLDDDVMTHTELNSVSERQKNDSACTPSDLGRPVPCTYCRVPIPAESFSYWSLAKELVSAECPACDRRMTLGAASWRRWSRWTPNSPA